MRIGIVGTQNNGKTTLVQAIKQIWPNYKVIEGKYRQYVSEHRDELNQNGTLETQKKLRDFLCDDAIDNSSEKYTVTDRTILDNVVYTLWLGGKDKLLDDDFISTSINICRETIKMYDLILWLPLNEDILLTEEKVNRDLDATYREEIDYIFQAVYDGYLKHDGILFDVNDQPPMIPLMGDLSDKIATLKEYIDENGDSIVTEQSVLSGLEEMYDKAALFKQLSGK